MGPNLLFYSLGAPWRRQATEYNYIAMISDVDNMFGPKNYQFGVLTVMSDPLNGRIYCAHELYLT